MPDNVPITAGVWTDIATDQLLTGEHVQLLKLVDGTANSSTRIEAGGGAEAAALRVTIATAPSSHIVFWRCGVYMFRPGFATQIRRIPA